MATASQILENIKFKIETKVKKNSNKIYQAAELHACVPDRLRERVEKILTRNIFEGDDVFEEDTTKMRIIAPNLDREILKNLPNLNDILEERDISADKALDLMQFKYRELKLAADERVATRKVNEKQLSWLAEYVRERRGHRVIWKSKMYRDADPKRWHQQSMIQNVDFMVDLAAQEFVQWVNSLASDQVSKTMTSDLIKNLFAIHTEGTAVKGLHVDSADLFIVPSDILAQFGESNLDHRWRLDKQMKAMRKSDRIGHLEREREYAFGRHLPLHLKQRRRPEVTKEIALIFPEKLRMKETMFKNIEHLQVTRSLYNYLEKDSQFPVPEYLRKNSLFNKVNV